MTSQPPYYSQLSHLDKQSDLSRESLIDDIKRNKSMEKSIKQSLDIEEIHSKFEEDLCCLYEYRIKSDDDFAKQVYQAITNVDWEHKESQWTFSRTFRAAGDLIADIRDKGEIYLDWYCCADEGVVSEEIATGMKSKGWTFKYAT